MANIIVNFLANGTWTCPTPAPTGVTITLIGGGGGGATSNTTAGGSGGGGGASCDSAGTWNPTAGVTYTIVVPAAAGAGGAGGTVSLKNGATVIAQVVGGKAGTIAAAGAGGLSTNANAVTPAGWNKFSGGSGAARSTTTGGGGGGAAGQSGAGGNAVGTTGGTGNGLGGNGGTGGAPGVAGGTGTVAGGGGGGSGAGTGLTGGSADNGKVRILYPDTTPPTIGASTTWNVTTTIDPSFLNLLVNDDGDTTAQCTCTITGGTGASLFLVGLSTTTETTNYGLTSNSWYLICPRGTPPGSYTVDIQATDLSSNSTTTTFTITVSESSGLQLYSNTIIGTGPYSWTAPSGTTTAAVEIIGSGGKGVSGTNAGRRGVGGAGGAWADCASFTLSSGDTIHGTLPVSGTTTAANNTASAISTVSGTSTNQIVITTAGTGETKRAKYIGGAVAGDGAGTTLYGNGGASAAWFFSDGTQSSAGTTSGGPGSAPSWTGGWSGSGGDGGPPSSTGSSVAGDGLTAGGGGGGAGAGSTSNQGGAAGVGGVKIWYLAPAPSSTRFGAFF